LRNKKSPIAPKFPNYAYPDKELATNYWKEIQNLGREKHHR
jgi:hypothetical protein